MSKLKRALYGWKKSDASIYAFCYERFGGSVNMHPEVIRFFATHNSQPVAYYHKKRNGEYIAAYALLGEEKIGVDQWKNFPLSYDEIMLPIAKGETLFFSEKANKISHFNKGNFRNVNFAVARKTKVCFAKSSYSSKTEKNRRNEYNRFLRAGGRCSDLNQYNAEELAEFYIFLFESRFTDKIECYSKENLITIIKAMKHMVFGHILFIGNEPCAMDLIFMAESESIIYFDVPNGGINMKYIDLSPGSLLMWMNIKSAREYCAFTGKEMRFSMGSVGKDWAYKLRWANALTTGKTMF